MSKQLLSCKYEYCNIFMYKPELIDNLYCSLECKRLDAKQTVTEKELFINKSTVDLKHHSKKSQKRISKRKQLLTTYCSEDMVKENNDWDEQLKLIFNKISTKQTQSLLKPSLPIISPESIDDDDKFVDLKVYIYS